MATATSFWPNGSRFAVGFSLMFEAGGQPISGTPGFFQEPMEKGLPDRTSGYCPILFVAPTSFATGSAVTVGGGGVIV